MAVVVPAHEGDLDLALGSILQWPSKCSNLRRRNMDLIVYYAGREDSTSSRALDELKRSSVSCFKSTKIIYARLTEEEMVYPKGPSTQFYKMFLDEEVKGQLSSYDVLSLIEWDVIVAHDTSFERLYSAAFYNDEAFWVKGSTLDGDNFHDTAVLADSWHVVGHLNGNAIYNNTDPTFKTYLNYTRQQWGYAYPFDVAIWATLSDLPYSWLLWQRYSHKFVASNLISNVGFLDVSNEVLQYAIDGDTLFVHGSTGGTGSRTYRNAEAKLDSHVRSSTGVGDCTRFCGGSSHGILPKGTSTVCDPSCSLGGGKLLPRFGGYLCGAGDDFKYGKGCRLCYTDLQEAQRADMALWDRSMQVVDRASNGSCYERPHVIMCDTLSPPPAENCHEKCNVQGNAVCDATCSDQRFGAYNCNFRGYDSCRSCFIDEKKAREVDTIARLKGGRAIMCNTHEPPLSQFCQGAVGEDLVLDMEGSEGDDSAEEDDDVTSEDSESSKPYRLSNVDHRQYCIVIRGYQNVVAETILTVESVCHFMAGAKIVIATHPSSFFSFERALAAFPDLTIHNISTVNYAELWADQMCDKTTSFIYYVQPGTIVMRSPRKKDIFSPTGELLVQWHGVEKASVQDQRRSSLTSTLVGFESRSFLSGVDLILPRDANAELRKFLKVHPLLQEEFPTRFDEEAAIANHLNQINKYDNLVEISIPEALASLAFARGHHGIQFFNPIDWTNKNLFQNITAWDIPLIRPSFSCKVNMRLAYKGYDLSLHLRNLLQSFKYNSRNCELGYISLQKAGLGARPGVEFGPATGLSMPPVEDFDISVMYRTFYGDAFLFEVSLLSVIDRFPSAREVVVVIEERDEDLFKGILKPHIVNAPFPIRIVTEETLMDGHIQQQYSKMLADLYCEGDFILHMDSDVVIIEDLSYDHMFKFGKPVLPFRRYRDDTDWINKVLTVCWKNGTVLALGEDVVHEFSIFNTHVYPREVYPATRSFIEKKKGVPFVDYMSTRRGRCLAKEMLEDWTLEERNLVFSEFNVLGAYLW
ncbi:unnamed protein product [Choristocarpus tenellus]